MDLKQFGDSASGHLVDISNTDPVRGEWQHKAFIPDPLPIESPVLSAKTYREVANARAALASLDSTARQLPNPTLLRQPTLRREAQSTSALEGTYAPLSDVLTADEQEPTSANLREILNYVAIADQAFRWIDEGRPISLSMLCGLQGRLVRETPADGAGAGDLRKIQVVIGHRGDAGPNDFPAHAARFVPSPPGDDLRANVSALIDWMRVDRSTEIDPVVAAAMSHYQFETLHPFEDGNGRIGRLLVVVYFYGQNILSEPTLTVSPWFEARRTEYYDRLLAVSKDGDWDSWVRFFANGIQESADTTQRQMLGLVAVQEELKEIVRSSKLRADTALMLVDYAVANVSFTVRGVERGLEISYGRANVLVNQLIELGILVPFNGAGYNRRFYAPRVLDTIIGANS